MTTVARPKIDPLTVGVLAAVAAGALLPVSGQGVAVAELCSTIAIGLLFFLYGARLKPIEALRGLANWRLQTLILAFTFVVFPILGVCLHAWLGGVLGAGLSNGLLFLCLVPSTVQSSVTFTAVAGGNVAGSIVAATMSNLVGVFATPALVYLTMGVSGSVNVSGSAIWDVVVQLLLPFVAGQLARPLIGGWVAEHKAGLKYYDQGVIVLVVYLAFSAGMREGVWTSGSWVLVLALVLIALGMVLGMCWLTWQVATWLGFSRADRITVQFCGTKKSLATGLPMATVLFAGQPIGLIVLPLMLFHQIQLLVCAWLANRYASRPK